MRTVCLLFQALSPNIRNLGGTLSQVTVIRCYIPPVEYQAYRHEQLIFFLYSTFNNTYCPIKQLYSNMGIQG